MLCNTTITYELHIYEFCILNREEKLCKRLFLHREAGHRLNIVFVSEGAIDQDGNRITSEYVMNVLN